VNVRRQASSGGPWEARAGYSRAIVAGDTCFVSGTTDAGPDGRSLHPDDIGAQAEAILETIGNAVASVGFAVDDVVRTRMFVTDISRSGAVLEVHRRWFDEVRPAATMVEVAASSIRACSSRSRSTPTDDLRHHRRRVRSGRRSGGMADAADLKSAEGNLVRVRISPPVRKW
jgi:enamine deaminase RidA (YjgF/YER057c/UK114 family)